MNKYSAELRTFVARNLHEATLNPPNDLTIASNAWVKQIAIYSTTTERTLNKNTNINVRRAGVFCNFADGLVFKDPSQRIDLRLAVFAIYQGAKISSAAGVTAGSKNLIGSGSDSFTTDLSAGDIVFLNPGGPYRFHIIDSVTNDNLAVMNDYAPENGALDLYKTTALPGDETFHIGIPVLNYMFEVGEYMAPTIFNTATNLLDVIIRCEINCPQTLTFLTKSINTDFADDTAFFDVILDVEYTP